MSTIDTGYVTAAQASVRLMTHPSPSVPTGDVVDCAFFRLSAGATPVHIWNYASGRKDRDYGAVGQQGGSPFDDTALLHESPQLHLVLNEPLAAQTEHRFKVHTAIGEVDVVYQNPSTWTPEAPPRPQGYRLIGGRVARVARSVVADNGTFPVVVIYFEQVTPLGVLPDEDDPVYVEVPDGTVTYTTYGVVVVREDGGAVVDRFSYDKAAVAARVQAGGAFRVVETEGDGTVAFTKTNVAPGRDTLSQHVGERGYVGPVVQASGSWSEQNETYVWDYADEVYVVRKWSDIPGVQTAAILGLPTS